MAGILCLPIRISTRNAISIVSRISIRNKKTASKAFNIPLLKGRYNVFSCTTNNNEKATSLFNVQSRYFKISSVLYEELDVNVPIFPEAISQGDIRWRKKVGDSVQADEVVCDIETDKTVIEVPSPASGVIVATYADEGAAVVSKQKVFRIKVGAVAEKAKDTKPPDKPAASMPQPAPKPQPIPEQKTTPQPPPVQPAAPIVPPAAPIAPPAAPIAPPEPQVFSAVKAPPKDPTREITGTRTEHRVKMTKIRQIIAQRLKKAQNDNAMLTTFNEIDMSNLIAFRKAHQEAFSKKHGIKLGFMSSFVKASAYALQDQPIINAHICSCDEIIYRDYIDISVAVATPKGLVVPVIRDVHEMNYADIEKTIVMLSEKAKTGKLTIEDMNGGTFTISNGGVFGSLMGTPIINPPQSAILGMHATFERPVAVQGKVVIKPMMYVALTYDHRLIDGREAVLFLRKIKSGVENPVIIIAGI